MTIIIYSMELASFQMHRGNIYGLEREDEHF